MPRVLIVAPAFPPHPSPATHRARFLTRYAAENGWEAEVLTVDPRYYAEPLDVELLRLLPSDLRVTHVKAMSPTWTRRVGFSDLALRSYVPLLRALRQICRERRPDVLFIPGGPFYQFRLGARMKAEFGVPYVLDYTDPWVFQLTPKQDSPLRKAFWSRALAAQLEPYVVRSAAHIVAVSDGTNNGIRERHPEIPSTRFSAMPFGFEAGDFEIVRAHPRANPFWHRSDENFHVASVGAMLPHGYETLRALFGALIQLRQAHPRLAARVRMHFVGTTYDPLAERGLVAPIAVEMGVADVVTEHPRRVPYFDALNLLVQADGVLGLGSTEPHYTASKIFPCILARRPLLAIYHEASTVCDIVRESRAGALVTYSDRSRAEEHVGQIAVVLEQMLAGAYTSCERAGVGVNDYSAGSMSRRIFRVFDAVAPSASVAGRGLVGAEIGAHA